MKLTIKRFDKELPLPEYKTSGAVGLDLTARISVSIPPRGIMYIPLNVAIKIPVGYFGLLSARSSLHKKGLMPANGVGIIDADYSGDEDEYIAPLFNFTDQPIQIEKGERLMQVVFLPHTRIEWDEVEQMGDDSRGGFGTTGNI